MRIEEVAIADGKVESVRTCLEFSEVVFVDWQEVRWRLQFNNVLSVEKLNIEGEELDRLEIAETDPYIARVRGLVDEPDAEVKAYNFFIPWKDEPRLRVVASSCNVETITHDAAAAKNERTEGER